MNAKTIKLILIVILVIIVLNAIMLTILNNLPPASNNDSLQQILPRITERDIEKGWYYGSKSQKKIGTPKDWVFCGNGSKNDMWVSQKIDCN